MIPLILKILLSVLFFYSSFVSVYINFAQKEFNFLSLFFSFSLCSLCLLLFYHLFQNIKKEFIKKEKASNTPPLPILVLCFASFLIGFFNISSQYSRGLSLDESSQFRYSVSGSVINVSFAQQQPPLDYYFSVFSGKLFKNGKFAVRFHAVFFYLLLSFFIPFGLYYYSSLIPAGLGSLLFLGNHFIRLHAVDARPLNLALLTGFLFLFFYIQFFESKQKISLIPLICSQYLFTLSIGLQPVIFIITLFLSSLLFYSQKKEILKKLFISNLISAGLILPFYIQMIDYAKGALKFKNNISAGSFTEYFRNWSLFDFLEKYFFSFYDKMMPVFLLFMLAWLLLIQLKKIKADQKILLLLSSLIFFPVLFDILFQNVIWWGKFSRYFITFSLPIIFCFVLVFHSLNSYFKKKKYYLYILISFLMLFSASAVMQALKIKKYSRFEWPYRDSSVEQAYIYLKEKGKPKDFFMEICLETTLDMHHIDIVKQSFHFHDKKNHPALIDKWIRYIENTATLYPHKDFSLYYIDWNKKSIKGSQTVFFITQKDTVSEKTLSQLMQKTIIGRFAIFEHTFSSQNKEREYIHFLQDLKNKSPKLNQSSLLETLLYYSYKKQDQTEFNKLLKEYKELKNHLPEYMQAKHLSWWNYPIHLDLEKRVNFFENLDWN